MVLLRCTPAVGRQMSRSAELLAPSHVTKTQRNRREDYLETGLARGGGSRSSHHVTTASKCEIEACEVAEPTDVWYLPTYYYSILETRFYVQRRDGHCYLKTRN